MNVQHGAVVAVLSVALPAGAAAQSTQPPTGSGDTAATPQQQTNTVPENTEDSNHWVASGFVGSNFANNANTASMEFGGAIGYLLQNKYGLEFDTGFTPNFDLQSNFFGLGIKPQVNTYMGNVVFAPPLGPEGQWQPFISGGVGAVSLRSGLIRDPINASLSPNDTRFGGDIGAGFMRFADSWGFKADVRYYRAAGSYNTTVPTTTPGTPNPPPGTPGYPSMAGLTGSTASTTAQTAPSGMDQNTSLASTVLSGLHFWRANVGVAVRW